MIPIEDYIDFLECDENDLDHLVDVVRLDNYAYATLQFNTPETGGFTREVYYEGELIRREYCDAEGNLHGAGGMPAIEILYDHVPFCNEYHFYEHGELIEMLTEQEWMEREGIYLWGS